MISHLSHKGSIRGAHCSHLFPFAGRDAGLELGPWSWRQISLAGSPRGYIQLEASAEDRLKAGIWLLTMMVGHLASSRVDRWMIRDRAVTGTPMD